MQVSPLKISNASLLRGLSNKNRFCYFMSYLLSGIYQEYIETVLPIPTLLLIVTIYKRSSHGHGDPVNVDLLF